MPACHRSGPLTFGHGSHCAGAHRAETSALTLNIALNAEAFALLPGERTTRWRPSHAVWIFRPGDITEARAGHGAAHAAHLRLCLACPPVVDVEEVRAAPYCGHPCVLDGKREQGVRCFDLCRGEVRCQGVRGQVLADTFVDSFLCLFSSVQTEK